MAIPVRPEALIQETSLMEDWAIKQTVIIFDLQLSTY